MMLVVDLALERKEMIRPWRGNATVADSKTQIPNLGVHAGHGREARERDLPVTRSEMQRLL